MIAKQIEIRNNIKKYFDIAYEGDPVIVPRKYNRNVVIISEQEYSRLSREKRIDTYAKMIHEGISLSNGSFVDISQSIQTDNFQKLKMISELKENWNQNGSHAFPKALIEKVGAILEGLQIQPELFPTALCTIQLEYDNSRRDHMEIEIGESDIAEVFVSLHNRKEYIESVEASAEAINIIVGEFYG